MIKYNTFTNSSLPDSSFHSNDINCTYMSLCLDDELKESFKDDYDWFISQGCKHNETILILYGQ